MPTSPPAPAPSGARRVLTPARVVALAAVAGAAYGVRRTANDVKRSWAEHRAAPREAEGPLARGAGAREPGPGLGVDHPKDIPPRGWFAIVKRAWKSQGRHNTSLLAAGVTYYAFLSIFPALIALVLVYGLVASPADVKSQVESFAQGLPDAARSLLTDQLDNLTSTDTGALSLGLVVAVGTALFSASAAINGLMGALTAVYGEIESRNIIQKRGTALLLTLGAIVFIVVAAFLLTVLPPLLDALNLGGIGSFLLLAARWIGLLLAFMVALAVLYRFGPARENAKLRWVGTGAIVATVLWIVVSVGFAVYANRGGYASTYGAVAGVVVLLLWLYFTAYAVLLGGEVNAQSELATAADTTTGDDRPIGRRGAFVADHVVGADGQPR